MLVIIYMFICHAISCANRNFPCLLLHDTFGTKLIFQSLNLFFFRRCLFDTIYNYADLLWIPAVFP